MWSRSALDQYPPALDRSNSNRLSVMENVSTLRTVVHNPLKRPPSCKASRDMIPKGRLVGDFGANH